jgi:neuroligin
MAEQRLGCVHGEELAYIFGAPLVPLLSHFGRNYTKAEVALSESVIAYWANFARNG